MQKCQPEIYLVRLCGRTNVVENGLILAASPIVAIGFEVIVPAAPAFRGLVVIVSWGKLWMKKLPT